MTWWALFGTGFTTGLSGAMIPGPLLLYTISSALRVGHVAGVQVALGHLVLEGMFVLTGAVGLRGLLHAPAFQATVRWAGGLGLMVMGSLMLLHGRQLSLIRHAQVECRWGPLIGGAVFSLSSPGFVLWWATIGAAVLLQGMRAGHGGVAAVSLGHACADVLWCWFVAFSVARGRAYCSDRAYRTVMRLMACGLMALGLWLLLAKDR